jgi:O-antigen ligase
VRVTASFLFTISTLAAVWIAPDTGAALAAGMLLLVGLAGAWLLAWAGRSRRTLPSLLGGVGIAATILGAALTLYALRTGGLATDGVGAAVNANVLAAALAPLLALGAAGGAWLVMGRRSRRRAWWVVLAAWGVLWLGGVLALIATGSRGAWAALLVAFLVAAAWAIRPWAMRQWRVAGPAIDIGLVSVAVVGVVLWLLLLVQPAPFILPAGERVALWRDGLVLIGDAPFTGSGLRSTMMALSTYVYILHVGFISHVHNLYLELAVEQGLVGLVAWGFLVLSALTALVQARRSQVLPAGMQAALAAALTALLVHGLVDAGLYASGLAPLLFLPIGAAWSVGGKSRGATWEARSRRLVGALTPLAAVALLFVWPGSQAAWQANLGAVAQTRVELFLYTWPEWPIQDALRRSATVDLAPAIARYQAALAYDPANVTANRRLGQIALSQGAREQARLWLETAAVRLPDHRATRLLLGEVYALAGEPARAAALWQPLDLSTGQLDVRRWWIGETGTSADVAAFDAAVAALRGG